MAMEKRVLGGFITPMPKKTMFPTFGYWMTPSFPTIDDVSRKDSGSAVLKSPSLPQDIDEYPVPAHFFDDIYQKDFWDVLIRKFGSQQLLTLMGSQVGVKATGLLGEDDSVDVHSRVFQTRPTETWATNLQRYTDLNPEERRTLELQERVLRDRSATTAYVCNFPEL